MQRKLCSLEQVPENSARGFRLAGLDAIVVRRDGLVYVYRNECPHLGLNLEFQPDQFMDAFDEYLQCSTHGAQFKVENGYCISGPCQGRTLPAIPFQLVNDQILVA